MENKELKDMSLNELKILCYDLLVQRDENTQQISLVNQAIQDLLNKSLKHTEPNK